MNDVVVSAVKENKKRYLDFLLDADPDEAMLDRYLDDGEMYVMTAQGKAVCVAVVLGLTDSLCELKNIATAPDYRGRGYATRMIGWLLDHYASRYAVMQVGTSEYGTGFYQKVGFTYSHTVKNFFTDHYPEPIVENGMQCVDMIYLKKETCS